MKNFKYNSDLLNIPGIVLNMEKHLQDIGINCINDLKCKDPEILYNKLKESKDFKKFIKKKQQF